jgi:SAM-dependent methyltransferase
MKLCKVYSLQDSHDTDPLWQDLLEQMCPDWKTLGPIHRKYWEWGLGLYGLHKLGFIRPDAVCLGVGAGVEWPLFYLANRVQRVYATDMYSRDTGFEKLDPTVPENAARLAPFPYRKESLVFERQDALDLKYPDNTFDFVFTFSSIEHFGGHAGAILAMQEIGRVLKPNGVAVIATELVIDDAPHHEFFYPHEVEPSFVQASGLDLVEPLDLSIDEKMVSNPVLFDYPPGFQGSTGPHSSVRSGGVTFTSIEFFLRKPAQWKPATRWTIMRLKADTRRWWAVRRGKQRVPSILRRAVKRSLRMLSLHRQ